MRVIYAFQFSVILILAGCSESAAPSSPKPHLLSPASRHIMDTSDKFILFSLEPNLPLLGASDTREKFHGYPILGQTEIKEAKEKSELLSAL